MTLSIKHLFFLSLLLCLLGCKKSQPGKPTINLPAKSIEVVSGNNQFGYTGKPLDTIVIKVTFNSAADTSQFSYFFSTGIQHGTFYIAGRYFSNNSVYIKVLWQPNGSNPSASETFYTYINCTSQQLKETGGCKTLDSVKLTATIRKPWVSVYYGSQGGLDVLYDLYFNDANNGLAIGEGSGVVRTADAGKTWTKGSALRPDDDLQQLSFSSPDTGLVILPNNYADFTYDGGKTFIQPPWSAPFVGDHSSSAYYMASRNVIYTVGWHGSIAKTVDGGASWTLYKGFTFLNNFQALTAVGKDTLYACGDVGKIVKTTDAGKTWNEQLIQLNNYLSSLYFINNNYGFAGGQYGALVRTTDGGANWNIIKTGLRFTIIAIRFFTSQHGFIVSNSGEIGETKDGGLTWTMRNIDNYGVYQLNKAVIKDGTIIFGLQESSIYTYDLTQN